MRDPVVSASLDGRLELFTSWDDGTIRHIWQFPDGSWSNWFSHGKIGNLIDSGFGTPALERNADGRLELFSCEQDSLVLYHKWQLAPNDGWSDWASLGKPGAGSGAPAVVLSTDGRLEVFTVSTDGSVYQIWQLTPNGSWSNWLNHGTPGEAFNYNAMAVHRNQDGRIEIFAGPLQSYKGLYHKWQLQPNVGWSNWVQLSGGSVGVSAVSASLDGRMELFEVAGVGSSLQHIWQLAPNGNWSNWFDHGSPRRDLQSSISLAPNQDGRLELRIPSKDGFIFGLSQVVPNGQWGDWFADSPQGISSGPALIRNHQGLLFEFVFGADGNLYFKQQTAPNGAWTDWTSLGQPQ